MTRPPRDGAGKDPPAQQASIDKSDGSDFSKSGVHGISDAQLPAESRITSRISGDVMFITVPAGIPRAGCLTGSWSGGAVAGFLAVAFITQGLMRNNPFYSMAGALGFGATGWQLGGRFRAIFSKAAPALFEIAPTVLRFTEGGAAGSSPRNWNRAEIRALSVIEAGGSDRGSLKLGLWDGREIKLPGTWAIEESRWLAEQIRRKWNLSQL